MKCFLAFCLFLAPVCAQSLPNLPDDAVVASFDDGSHMTMGDFRKIYAVLPPENQQQALHNRKDFVQQWALMRKLARLAEADKLDQLSPSKEALEYYRLVILSQAKMSRVLTDTLVLPSQVQEQYDKNKDQYKQVRVKAIYIGFDGRKLTEADAKAKAARLLAQARGGADFAKLARDSSDDETSRAKGGDFATLRPNDNVPDAVRDAVFKLKEGEISDPVRQPNGYYLFRAQEVSFRPYAEVRDEIFGQLKQKYYQDWVEKINREALVVIMNPSFFGFEPPTPTLGSAPPPAPKK